MMVFPLNFSEKKDQITNSIPWIAVSVIFLGFALRLYASYFTPVINPDGIRYIQQAKALYFGQYDSILSCYFYLPNYSIFIYISYFFSGDWISAAKNVSIFFGTITLVPFYLLFRRFFNPTISVITLLVFAVMPAYVILSRNVIRGPVLWFFAVLGLYLFVLQMDKKKSLYLSLSCLCFLMAAWARIESILYFIISAGFLIFIKESRSWRHLFMFLLPVIIICASKAIFLPSPSTDLSILLEPQRITDKVTKAAKHYSEVRTNLKKLKATTTDDTLSRFIHEARRNILLIPLGTLAAQIYKTLTLPFLLLFLFGIYKAKHLIFSDNRLFYLSCMSGGGIVILYCQLIKEWIMSERFIVIFILPAFIFTGFGIQKISHFFSSRLKNRYSAASVLLSALIFFVALPKNLNSHHRERKTVYMQIGQYVEKKDGEGVITLSAGNFKDIRYVNFYGNLGYPGAPCLISDGEASMGRNIDPLWLRQNGFSYYLWDEKNGSQEELQFLRKKNPQNFEEIEKWQAKKEGEIILFELRTWPK